MNESSINAPLPPPPPPGSSKPRPFWSSVDILLAIPFIIAVVLVGTIFASLLASGISDWDGTGDLPVYGLFIAVVFQQFGQGLWPWIVSKRKGLGMAIDWKFRFEWPTDLGLGIVLAIICVVGSTIATALMSVIIGLGDDEDPSNTSILSDNQDSPWLIGVILLVVIGAPLSEELLFRGLILRALEKDLGIYVAIIGSTLLFTLPHMQAGATTGETMVLLAGIATIGLVLGIATVRLDRLGPAIIGHFFFNAFGTAMTLIG